MALYMSFKKYIMSFNIAARLHMLPDFIIIGAMKCGTTSLFRYLEGHPDFYAPKTKEIHYFDFKYDKGLDWYRRQFPTKIRKLKCRLRRRRLVTGEASPYYMYHPHACRRIAALLPGVKLIVLLRNPVDRAYSHYHNEIRHGRESLTFEQALELEPERLRGEVEKMVEDERYFSVHHGHHAYLARGIYVEQLKACRAYFPRDQFLILDSDALFFDPQPVYDRVCDFVGLARHRIAEFKTHNPGGYQEQMSPALRRKLAEYYAPHNEALCAYLGMEFDWAKPA